MILGNFYRLVRNFGRGGPLIDVFWPVLDLQICTQKLEAVRRQEKSEERMS